MTTSAPDTNPEDIWVRAQLDAQARATLRARVVVPMNKTALFDALPASGIDRGVVTFDGTGQIEDTTGYIGDTTTPLPDDTVEYATPSQDGQTITTTLHGVAKIIEMLVYDLQDGVRSGWEDNAGAYGEFTFDVAERKIALGVNERVESSEHSAFEW